jgi:hypothetical protein
VDGALVGFSFKEGQDPMKIGTKSVLFGAHQFILHPIALAIAWTVLYGFPRDLRLLVAFVVHDWGYVGKNNMDGDEGERHPLLGAAIMRLFFGKKWGDFTLYHSRFYARRRHHAYSRLAVADLPLVCLTGEVHEYMDHTSKKEGVVQEVAAEHNATRWYRNLCSFMRQWVQEHKDVPEPMPA